jgi:C1A family cysteine protease
VNTGLTDEEFAGIKRTLNQGWPVCSGLRWPKQEKWKSDVLQMCPPEAVFDGHSVLLVGYRDDPNQPDGGVFIFRNTNRGGRDGFMPYAYARTYMNDAAWIAPADNSKPSPVDAEAEDQRN